MTTSIVDIFNTYKNESDTTADSVATTYANLDIEWVVKDGNQTISANTSWGSATADTRNLLVLVKGNLTVDAGYTLTAAARKRGMFIYVNGDLNLNGIISMTARGASAAGQRLLLLSDDSDYEIPAAGGAGGAAIVKTNGSKSAGNTGTSGVATGAPGGGGSGACVQWNTGFTLTSGAGGAGTSYSGGAGGGGIAKSSGTETAGSGSSSGGAGGNGADGSSNAAGGSGNPGGTGTGGTTDGLDGTGGLLVIYVTGTLTFGASGKLESNGVAGGTATKAGGGGTGGGRIDYFYNAVSGSPTITVTGGAGGAGTTAPDNYAGGAGGAGSSRATEVSLPDLMGSTSSNFFMFF